MAQLLRYRQAGKRLHFRHPRHLRHVSPGCRELPDNARGMIAVSLAWYPRYRIAGDKLA